MNKIIKNTFIMLLLSILALQYTHAEGPLDKGQENYDNVRLDILQNVGVLTEEQQSKLEDIQNDNIIKIKTQFDFYKEKEMEEVMQKRNEILNSIKFSGFVEQDLDSDISNTYIKIDNDKDGFYIVSTFKNGDILKIGSAYYYIEDYSVVGNTDLKSLIKEKILENKGENNSDVLDMLNKYKIKHYKIQDLEFKVFVQHYDNKFYKEEIPLNMFLNMEYASPYLDNNDMNGIDKYFWGYIGKDEILKQGIKLDKFVNEIHLSINDKYIYMGKFGEKVYKTNIIESHGLNVYNIYKNYNEYGYILVIFVLGLFIGYVLFLNFLNKLNKQIEIQPEEF